MTDIERLISQLVSEDEPLWWPGAASVLTAIKWKELERQAQIEGHHYSTSRFLLGKAYPNTFIAGVDFKQAINRSYTPPVEVLPKVLEDKFQQNGLCFYTANEIYCGTVLESLNCAIQYIRAVPSLFETVNLLARSIVLLRPEDDVFDVSYSSPNIPFSVFVSVPATRTLNDHLRIAEAIIHECMHLQLTLLEEKRPLFANHQEKYFSPWKGELRNSSGVFHALYVFAVIQSWLLSIQSVIDNREYINKRITQISMEAAQLTDFQKSNDLTPVGTAICHRLFLQLLHEDDV